MRLRRDLVRRAGRKDDRALLVDAIQNAIRGRQDVTDYRNAIIESASITNTDGIDAGNQVERILTRHGTARHGGAWRGEAGQGEARHGTARQGEAYGDKK